jgi:hypothetical protein
MTKLAIVIGLCCASFAAAEDVVVNHPTVNFNELTWGHESLIEQVRTWSDDRLLASYTEGIQGDSAMPTEHYARLYAVAGAWQRTQDAAYRDLAARLCRIMLGDLIDADDQTLRALPHEAHGFAPESRMARDAALHFAMLYHLTGDQEYAHRSAVLLKRITELSPNWPIQNPHYGPMEDRVLRPRDWPGYVDTDRVNGVWGYWIYRSINAWTPILHAYDLIHDSGELQRIGALGAVEAELDWAVQYQLGYGREMGNMDKETMKGLIAFGKVLGRPQLVHHCIDWIRDMYQTMFYADGWWHEGSVAYHQQIHKGMVGGVIDPLLQGYSDPPGWTNDDGVRYDNLDMYEHLAGPIGRAQAVLDNIHQPNGNYQAIHDTTYPQADWEKKFITEARSHLWGAMGHAILGVGKDENMVQATLHFSGMHGHAHQDMNNLMLFAKGKELISETRYRPPPGSNSTRQWHTITAGHVTVAIDESSQSGTATRQRQPADAHDGGVPDGKYRWRSHGNSISDGRLRLHSDDWDMVQVVEADGERAYSQTLNGVYRRTVALVQLGGGDTYVVDIFRVRGGQTHDYMLHGCLDDPHDVALSVPLDETIDGTLYGYIHDLRTTRTDDAWTASFDIADSDASLITFMAPSPGTRIIRGIAPAMRRIGDAPFLAVRREGGESIFVTVHHPFIDTPRVEGIELIDAAMDKVTVQVIHDGGVDRVTSTADGFTHERLGQWRYEVGGKQMHHGVITRTSRIEAGDDINAFITPAELPTDGSLDGRTIMIDSELITHSYTIDRIERRGGETIIHTDDEPGMRIEPNLVKLTYFPGWGMAGDATFRIAGSRLTME